MRCFFFWKKLHSWQKNYTTDGHGGRDKFQLWYDLFRKKNKERINHGAAQFTSANFYLAPIFVFVRLIEYKVCKDNQKMSNNGKLRLNLMQTNLVSLEDCKYLQSQERFKVVSPVQSQARYRVLGS